MKTEEFWQKFGQENGLKWTKEENMLAWAVNRFRTRHGRYPAGREVIRLLRVMVAAGWNVNDD